MVPNSTDKIVSLHMEPCSYDCPNSDICYHRHKETSSGKTEEVLPVNFRTHMLKKGYLLHESVCKAATGWQMLLLNLFENYNITIPYPLFIENRLERIVISKKQVQITVYSVEQAKRVINYQKLFLIKNNDTLNYAIRERLWDTPYTHFCINQDWITKDKLQELMYYRMLSNTIGITIDSCAESWIINGRCPYNHGYYIDITYDGTLRTCPFNKVGVPISEVYNGDYESLFKLRCTQEKCQYSKIFMEK